MLKFRPGSIDPTSAVADISYVMESGFPILVADDSADDVFLIERALKRVKPDCKIAFVNSFEEAIGYLEGRSQFADRQRFPFPNLIISDASMPSHHGGFDILYWLQSHSDAQPVPVIICSGNLNPDFIRKAYKLGANSYFAKPNMVGDMEKFFDAFFQYWKLTTPPTAANELAN